MNRSAFFGPLFFLILGRATVTHAATVYDNGAPTLTTTGGYEITHWINADNFTLNDGALLSHVTFWDLEGAGWFQSSILWQIYSDSGSNTPGTLLFSGTSVNLTHTATGRADLFVPSYLEYISDFDISPPVSLPRGNYWLALHNGPLTFNTNLARVYWETSNNPSTISSRTIMAPFTPPLVWDTNNIGGSVFKVAFQLTGVAGPHVTAFIFNTGAPRVSFTTSAGQNYRVEYKNNLTDTSWTPVSGATVVAGTDGVVQISDPSLGNQTHRFYRVVLITGP